MESIAWVNGEITDLADARVSFLDRGYLFGDGVYEAMKVFDSRILAMDRHLDRLERSMEGIRIRPTWKRPELENTIRDLVARSGFSDALIYLQVTRGVAPRQHAFSPNLLPTLAIYVSHPHPVDPEVRERGVKAITVPDERWAHPHIKTLNLLPNVLARQQAAEQGAHEAIFVRDGGLVTECSSSNVFAVIADQIVTPPTDGRILPGVTRDLLLTAAREAGYPVKEDYITLEQLRAANEIFVTSTSVEALGVVELDGRPVGQGLPGRLTGELYRLFVSRWLAQPCRQAN